MRDQLTKILGLNKEHQVAIIGAGRLGTALTDYYGFTQTNFTVVALFDSEEEKIGQTVGEVEVFDIKDFAEIAKRYKIDVAVIAIPATYAQKVLEQVMQTGIKAIMNFAPTPLRVEGDVKLKTIDLTTSLESLSYFLAQPINSNGKSAKQIETRRRKKEKENKKLKIN